jgi:hypothetical protein
VTDLDVDRPVVVVDDQLALLAARDVLMPADDSIVVTTYGWQQRVLGAFVAPRATRGQLQAIAADARATAAHVLAAVGSPDPQRLIVVDPREHAVEIARARVDGTNGMTAETIVAARTRGAVVRVSPGNARGHFADRVLRAGLDLGIWDPTPPP